MYGHFFTQQEKRTNVLYLLTQINSRKANQIEQNSHVGFAIDRDAQSIQDRARSKYIKEKGTAVIITEQKEIGEAVDALMAKFPYLADNPGDSTDLVGIRLTLHHVIVSDHTIKFGHTEDIVFPQE